MKFDTIIIGGGLAGLISGIRLQKAGRKSTIVSGGQCALHFSSGSLDLLHTLPDGTEVINPQKSLPELIRQSDKHPYSKIGEKLFGEYTKIVPQLLNECGVNVFGSSEKNNFRMTPFGTFSPTWLTFNGCLAVENPDSLTWKKICVFGINGFLDFYQDFIQGEMIKRGIECKVCEINIPEFEILRNNPTEMRSVNLARALKRKMEDESFVQLVKEESQGCDTVIFPALVNFDDVSILKKIVEKIGINIYMLPTLPPSVMGIDLQKKLQNYFKKLGGILMNGDKVISYDINNNEIECVYTENHENISLKSNSFILASGGIFSKGIIATKNKTFEPIFGVDVDFNSDRSKWYSKDVFENQPYQFFGIKTDSFFRPFINGQSIKNLYVAGAGLEGFNSIKEGSGAGISILTGLRVADIIIKGE